MVSDQGLLGPVVGASIVVVFVVLQNTVILSLSAVVPGGAEVTLLSTELEYNVMGLNLHSVSILHFFSSVFNFVTFYARPLVLVVEFSIVEH